jgi:hypothetical protein
VTTQLCTEVLSVGFRDADGVTPGYANLHGEAHCQQKGGRIRPRVICCGHWLDAVLLCLSRSWGTYIAVENAAPVGRGADGVDAMA